MAQNPTPEEFKLSNGIPVILQDYEGSVAATYWWVKTGSADETPREAGFAHFLEHMLFKDAAAKETGAASTGQMAREIEALGGDINAYTSFDQTVYHVTCAAHHWERVLDAFCPMAKPQKFLKSDFEREREVILEELRKNEDAPGRQLFQELFSQTFRKHAYGKPVIGFVKTLNAAKVQELEAFYRKSYVPSRMGLILVGPLGGPGSPRRAAIMKKMEQYFGGKVLKERPGKWHPRVREPELRSAPSTSVKAFDVKMPSLTMSFRVPELEHEDMPALDVLAGVLGSGELSRVYQKLFYDTSLVTEASGGLYVPSDAGMLYFQAEMDSISKIHPTAETLLKELKRIQSEGPTPDELARVIANAESEKLYATQSADGVAGRIGFLRFIMGDLGFDQRYLEDLRAVTPGRVKEVAKKYLDHRRLNIVAMVPKEEKGFDLTGVARIAQEILPGASEAGVLKTKTRGKSTGMPVEFFKLPSGIRVAHFHRPHSQVFSVHASALGGSRLETAAPLESAEKDWGASNLLAMSWTKGTSQRDAREISKIVEGRAAGMDGFSGRNAVGLQLTGLSRDWSRLSELFTEVLLEPTFPETEVEHSKRVTEDSIRGIEDHTSRLTSRLFLETLFEKHPYGKLTLGSLESVHSMGSEKLKKFHRAWLRPERMSLAVSGPIAAEEVRAWMEALEKQALRISVSGPKPTLPEALQDEPTLKAPRWVEKTLGREQTHLLVGGLGTRINSGDRWALRLLETLLGGQGGRLFVELREKKSLAYTVSPMLMEGLERGYVGTYIACSPSKKEEAVKGIRSVLESLVKRAPSARELQRAQEYYLGRRAMDLQSDSALSSHLGLELLYDLEYRTEEEIARAVEEVSIKDLQRVCRTYFLDAHQVTASVG